MNKTIASYCLFFLVVLVASFYLPYFYEQLFFDRAAKTHLFYSPVAKEFVYREKIVGTPPPEVQQKAEEQRAVVSYRTESGRWIGRLEFERLLPFIYYKNMEVRGLLPLEIDGRLFTKKEIKKYRRVFELKAREMKMPQVKIYPLLSSPENQAGLLFSKYRFFSATKGLEFVHTDTNSRDAALSELVTADLIDHGFHFPASAVFGNFTVLKPFDAGIFLEDNQGQLFHFRRNNEKNEITRIPLPPGVRIRYLKIGESLHSDFFGILIGEQNKIWLLSRTGYQIHPLPVTGYNPDSMDLKIIFNPLHITAIYSDDETVSAVAMTQQLKDIASFQHRMSRATTGVEKKLYQVLFPFVLKLRHENSRFIDIDLTGSWHGLIGLIISVLLYLGFLQCNGREIRVKNLLIIACSGVYGIIGLFCVDMED